MDTHDEEYGKLLRKQIEADKKAADFRKYNPKDAPKSNLQHYPEMKWIETKDQLPQEGKEVLVWSDRYGRTFATLCGQNRYGTFWQYHDNPIFTHEAPTHWMELPSKP